MFRNRLNETWLQLTPTFFLGLLSFKFGDKHSVIYRLKEND